MTARTHVVSAPPAPTLPAAAGPNAVVIGDQPSEEVPKHPRTPTENRAEPIQFTVDDNPPEPPPGTPVHPAANVD